ncbi:hypothetical protein PIB30_001710 [Stylosanthes scabra]|uniref:Uncharacterized protein n=1 Tax=Stylosanthes scabra TaxID=79078 RepID=A0ABU6U4P6_9FABA|nr:hypothetical protein [Stylosanthes scabra]
MLCYAKTYANAKLNAIARAGCRPACLISKLEGSLPKGYNDHLVPPVDAYLWYNYATCSSLGTWPLWIVHGPRHLTGVNHTGVYPQVVVRCGK